MPADDSWLGHMKVDPAKGKARPMGPEERRGRRDLGEVFNQGILREPKERQAELLRRGTDKMEDGWIGHTLIAPSSGKAPVSGVAATQDMLHGATFTREAEAAAAAVQAAVTAVRLSRVPPIMDSVPSVINGTAPLGKCNWA